MKLYAARHGKTAWNEQNKVCGRTDIPLSQQGIEQAQRLAEAAGHYKIDLIISSPLKRALETSEIVSKICGIPVITDTRLMEQDYGIYEGADRKDPLFLANKRNFAYRYPNGESMMQTAFRIYGLLNDIKVKYNDKNVMLISHGGVCRIINTYFQDMTNEEFFNYTLDNGRVEEYDF